MHNLHYVVVNAANHEEAEAAVESAIESWGDENNWRCICGSLNENGEAHSTGEGRWGEELTYEDVVKSLREAVHGEPWHEKEARTLMRSLLAGKKLRGMDFYTIRRYIEDLGANADANGIPKEGAFDPFRASYYEWKLDEFGITNLAEEGSTEPRFIVLVDMHS